MNDAESRLEKKLQEMIVASEKNTNAEAARHQHSFAKVIQETISHKIMDAETRLETKLQERMLKIKEANESITKRQDEAAKRLDKDLQLTKLALTMMNCEN